MKNIQLVKFPVIQTNHQPTAHVESVLGARADLCYNDGHTCEQLNTVCRYECVRLMAHDGIGESKRTICAR